MRSSSCADPRVEKRPRRPRAPRPDPTRAHRRRRPRSAAPECPASSSARSMNKRPVAAGFMLRGRRTSAPSIRCVRACCTIHSARPRRVVQVLVEAGRAAGQRGHRIVEAVADVAIGAEGQIHRPDEHGAVRRLERRVEVGVVPQAGADPHQPRAFARAGGDARPRRAASLRRGTRARAPAPSRCRAPTAWPSRC